MFFRRVGTQLSARWLEQALSRRLAAPVSAIPPSQVPSKCLGAHLSAILLRQAFSRRLCACVECAVANDVLFRCLTACVEAQLLIQACMNLRLTATSFSSSVYSVFFCLLHVEVVLRNCMGFRQTGQ
jgi:hypothetical protein